MKKKLFSLFIVLVFVLSSFSSSFTSDGIAQADDPVVTVEQAVLDEMQTKGSASYWIQLKNSVDLSRAYSMNWSDRGWFVYETLLKQAEVTQAQVIKYLTSSKVEYKSYWINNSILVTSSTITVLDDILKFDGVEGIGARKTYILYEPDTSVALLDNGINAIEPNLTHVNADDVWAMGIDGAGLVVANIDTGVRYSHQALVGQYRGNNGGTFDHNYNWFNPDDLSDDVPRDGNGHGTHTMGTMVGDDGGSNQIGIAPGAEWIACAGCPDGSCTDSALLGCGQFMAAPTDLNGTYPDPDKRPNAVNNSWGDCGTTYDNWYAGPINAWLAAGIYPIFSNGNASNCGYSAPPGLNTVGNPARSGNVTGVGSSGEQNGLYATHSNWGPTDDPDTVNPVTGFENLKPQVIAPGVSIRSSVPSSDTAYEDGWSGTSMSAPHVTGLIALIWQAAPCLVGQYAVTENLIESTAVDIVYDDGSPLTPTNFPNFATGWGEIDALAAVNMASGMCATGTLEGTVTTDGFSPVEGAKIFADNGAGYTKNIYSAANGSYSSSLPEGIYTLTASKYGYQSQTVTGIAITEGATTMQDFVIPQLGMSLVSGNVYDGGVVGVGAHGYPLYSSIHISASGFDQTIYTDPFTGYYEIELLDSATYTFDVQAVPSGYDLLSQSVTPSGVAYSKDFNLMVGTACSAPGYMGSGVEEHFETGTLPLGWVNYDYQGNGQVWQFNDPGSRGNLTPGNEGGFAIVDSDFYGSGKSQNTGLRTPLMDFSLEPSVILDFDTDFNYYSTTDSATVRVSADGGATWTDVWTKTADFNGHVNLDISAQAAWQANVIVEFRYIGSWGFWWQVDDVVITPIDCGIVPGGVVAGYVYDDMTDLPLVDADVYSDVVETQTFFIPEDPVSEGLYWVFHPTATDPEDVELTASMDLYGSDEHTVSLHQDDINRQDFYLGTGELSFNPTSFEVTMIIGDAPVTQTLTISNPGTADAIFELVEKDEGIMLSKLTIPAFKGELPEDTRPVSVGRAPEAASESKFRSPENPFAGILAGEPAYGVDLALDALKFIPDASAPGTWIDIGTVPDAFFAGDFVGGDFTKLYGISNTNTSLYTIDTSTGAPTLIGPSTPPSGHTWTGLSGTPSGELYGLTTNGSVSTLVLVDPDTGSVSILGNVTGVGAGIDLAYNSDDEMIYIVDIITDNLFKVDPTSLVVTQIGSTGVAANYAQGMDYEEESGILYWAAYSSSGELRILDTTTGASTLVGTFPGGAEVDSLAFATGGVSDVPWLSENPVSGTVPASGSVNVDIIFDPTGASLSQPGDYLAALKVNHDTPYTYPLIPVVLHLMAAGEYGTINGHVMGYEACDVNPAALEGATVNFWQGMSIVATTSTNAAGYYTYSLPAGTYDIEFVMNGFVTDYAEEVVLAAQTTVTVDMELRLIAPCISVDPVSLEQTQMTDAITTQTLTIINTGAGDGSIELLEIDGGYQAPAGSYQGKVPTYHYSPDKDFPGADRSKSIPIGKSTLLPGSNLPADILIIEGFEGAFPPTDWTQVINNASYTWQQSDGYVYEGLHGAYVPWNYSQDEWLLTPELALAEGTLSLYSQGSIYWCRDTYDNCDLNLWLVVGEVGGGDDIFIKNLDEDWPDNFTWTQASIDLAPYLPGVPVRIGFQLIGDDDADAAIDYVTLDGVEGLDVPWLSEDPVAGIVPADGSLDVTITYDSTGLAEGDYLATIRVKDPLAAAIDVPVTLHVANWNYIYLPLILR